MSASGGPLFEAIAIETLVQLVRAMLFFIPSNLGTQEGVFVLAINVLKDSTPLGLAVATTYTLDPDNVGIKEGVNFTQAWALPIFFFVVMLVFDYYASKRYGDFNEEILNQWKEDKIQFMKMFTEDARRKYDKNNDGKISADEISEDSDE